MSLLFPSPGPMPDEGEPKKPNILLRLPVTFGRMLVLSVAMAVYCWQKYPAKFSQVDNASEMFTVNFLPSAVRPNGIHLQKFKKRCDPKVARILDLAFRKRHRQSGSSALLLRTWIEIRASRYVLA
jgi:hypothetical protein